MKVNLSSFSLNTFSFVIFGAKILYEKLERKTLRKLTVGRLSQFFLTTLLPQKMLLTLGVIKIDPKIII